MDMGTQSAAEAQAPAASQPVESQHLSSVGDLIKRSFYYYRTGFWQLLGMQLVPVLAALTLAVVLLLFFGFSFFEIPATPAAIINVIIGLLGIAAVIFIIYASILAQAAILIQVKNIVYQQKKSIRGNLSEARAFMWMFVVINIMVGFFAFLWFLLFIIPGIIFIVYYLFATWTYIHEGFRSTAALKRSRELVRGHWWAVVGRMLLPYLAVFIAVLPMFFFPEKSLAFQAWNILYSLASFIITPFFVIYYYLIYLDLLAKKPTSAIDKRGAGIWVAIIAVIIPVVVIIGLLATLAVVSLNSARAKASDAARVADTKQIEIALESYYSRYDRYPTALNELKSGDWFFSEE